MSDVANKICDLYEQACIDLLRGMHCEVEPVPHSHFLPGQGVFATIDGGSDELELKVGVDMPLSVLAMTYPVPNVAYVKEDDLEDWARELANQLIGRLKTKLIMHGLEITLGLPDLFYESTDETLGEDDVYSVTLSVDWQVSTFYLNVELFDESFSMDKEPEHVEDVVFESEIELF